MNLHLTQYLIPHSAQAVRPTQTILHQVPLVSSHLIKITQLIFQCNIASLLKKFYQYLCHKISQSIIIAALLNTQPVYFTIFIKHSDYFLLFYLSQHLSANFISLSFHAINNQQKLRYHPLLPVYRTHSIHIVTQLVSDPSSLCCVVVTCGTSIDTLQSITWHRSPRPIFYTPIRIWCGVNVCALWSNVIVKNTTSQNDFLSFEWLQWYGLLEHLKHRVHTEFPWTFWTQYVITLILLTHSECSSQYSKSILHYTACPWQSIVENLLPPISQVPPMKSSIEWYAMHCYQLQPIFWILPCIWFHEMNT